jgi:hypothetical protein
METAGAVWSKIQATMRYASRDDIASLSLRRFSVGFKTFDTATIEAVAKAIQDSISAYGCSSYFNPNMDSFITDGETRFVISFYLAVPHGKIAKHTVKSS